MPNQFIKQYFPLESPLGEIGSKIEFLALQICFKWERAFSKQCLLFRQVEELSKWSNEASSKLGGIFSIRNDFSQRKLKIPHNVAVLYYFFVEKIDSALEAII